MLLKLIRNPGKMGLLGLHRQHPALVEKSDKGLSVSVWGVCG